MTEAAFRRTDEAIACRRERAEIYKNLRARNEAIGKPDDDDLFGLGGGSGGAKTSGKPLDPKTVLRLIKECPQKLKTLNAKNKDQIIEMLKGAGSKLARFTEEMVSGLMGADIKMTDIVAFVEVATLMNEQYKIAELLEPKINEAINSRGGNSRLWFCVYADLAIVRLFKNPTPFVNRLKVFMAKDKTSEFGNLEVMWKIFEHCAGDIFGVNKGDDSLIDAIFPAEQAVGKSLRPELKDYYTKLDVLRQRLAKEGMAAEEEAKRLLVQYGKTKTKQAEKAEQLKEQYDKLTKTATKIAFIMGGKPKAHWIEPVAPESPSSQNSSSSPSSQDSSDEQDFYVIKYDDDKEPRVRRTVLEIQQQLDILTPQNGTDACDDLAKAYLLIDDAQNREELLLWIKNISKTKVNQAPFYARFVAYISHTIPEIGQIVGDELKRQFISHITAQYKAAHGVGHTKLHVARYLAELAHFRVAISETMECILTMQNYFNERTVDMLSVVMFNAGRYLGTHCGDIPHAQIDKIISFLKTIKKRWQYKHHVQMTIDQMIDVIEAPETSDSKPMVHVPEMNKYQAYMQFVLMKSEPKNFAAKAKKVAEKMIDRQQTTKVDINFLIGLVLDLSCYSYDQYPGIAKFVHDFSAEYPEFGQGIVDILMERIRRGIECNKARTRQQQQCEIAFLAELVNADVVDLDVVSNTVMLILSLDQTYPVPFLISVQGPRKKSNKINSQPSDFFKATLVCSLLEGVLPTIREKQRTTWRQQWNNAIHEMMYWLQCFLLVRSPVPADVVFIVSDLMEKLSSGFDVPIFQKYASCDDIKKVDAGSIPVYPCIKEGCSPYALRLPKRPTQGRRLELENLVDDPDSSDDDGNERFAREKDDLFESFAAETKPTPTYHPLPIDIRSKPAGAPLKRISSSGPPPGFTIIFEDKKNERASIRI